MVSNKRYQCDVANGLSMEGSTSTQASHLSVVPPAGDQAFGTGAFGGLGSSLVFFLCLPQFPKNDTEVYLFMNMCLDFKLDLFSN